MKKFLIQIVLLLLVIIGALFFFRTENSPSFIPFLPEQAQLKNLSINGKTIKVEIADTDSARSKGLGDRDSLSEDSGMLFIFSKPDKYPFWMKAMKFPLDFIYISNNQVVDLIPNVPSPSPGEKDEQLPIYLPRVEVDKVLEVNAGTIQRLNIKVGDSIKQS